MPDKCYIAILTSFERQSLHPLLESIVQQISKNAFFEILIVDTREASESLKNDYDSDNINLEFPYLKIQIEFKGYAQTRLQTIDFVQDLNPKGHILFIDDDDFPTPGLIQDFYRFHLAHPNFILGAEAAPKQFLKKGANYPVHRTFFTGASYMFLPSIVLSNIAPAIDHDFDFCGGEDLQICLLAQRLSIPVLNIGTFTIFEEETNSAVQLLKIKRNFYHSWVYYSILFHHEIFRVKHLKAFAILNLGKCVLLFIVRPKYASIKLAGLICGYFFKIPPPRQWIKSK